MHATAADVTSAVEKRDVEELITINPCWKPVIDQDQMELLPKVFAPPEAWKYQLRKVWKAWKHLSDQAKRGLLMIEDKRDPESKARKCQLRKAWTAWKHHSDLALQTAWQESNEWTFEKSS